MHTRDVRRLFESCEMEANEQKAWWATRRSPR